MQYDRFGFLKTDEDWAELREEIRSKAISRDGVVYEHEANLIARRFDCAKSIVQEEAQKIANQIKNELNLGK